ncbi:MAG: hypothetical protein COT17_07780 [Elusimicrobia bacterium CG08_land_8_20_14_0_20_51_18]|nr:MAG: hypothetical protein COT17_07780 [Elusimicrobia bacterium CG08_land_8_20_14_0_20_51_18]
MNKELSTKEKISIFLRSFFIQAGWNYLRYQNIGYLFCVHGRLRKIYEKDEAFRKALLRNFEIFNTQPYMSCFVIGNALKMEEAPENPEKEKNILQIRQSLACAYASIGDRLFWARLRIAAFAVTVFLVVLLMNPMDLSGLVKLSFLSLLLPTLLYAGFSVYIRWKGLGYGYDCGGKSSCGLDFMNWNRLIKFSSLAGFGLSAFLLVFFSFVFVYSAAGAGTARIPGHLLFAISAIAAQRYFRARKKDLGWTVGAVFIFSFAINLLVKI